MDPRKSLILPIWGAFVLMLALAQCKPTTTLQLAPGAPRLPPTPAQEEVRLLLPQDRFADSAQARRLAYYRRGITVAGICTYQEVLDDLVAKGRSLGARTVRVRLLKGPDERSSCYRAEADFYR